MRVLVGESFAGEAETAGIPAGDNLGIHRALERAASGAVLCVASGGRGLYGVIGELMVEAARVRGLAAVVVEDGVRDIERLAPPPAIAGLRVASHGTVKRRPGVLAEPIGIDGVLVRPGDWIVGDRNGICVLPADRVDDIIESARARERREEGNREEIRRGIPTTRVFGLH